MTNMTKTKQTSVGRFFAAGATVGALLILASVAPAYAQAIELDPAVNGDVTISNPGVYINTDGGTFRTITLTSGGVTLLGLNFVGGGAATAVKNGIDGLYDVTIEKCNFSGYTGRTITYGFAEGVPSAINRGANWTIRENTIVQSGNNATAIAMFNVDGVRLQKNQVSFVAGTTGRRGFNLDSSSNVVVDHNTLMMSTTATPSVTTESPWAIQLSMSDAPVADVKIVNNTIFGAFWGIVGLSQRGLSGVHVSANTISAARGIAFNAGGSIPTGTGSTFQAITIAGNKMTVSHIGVQLRDLHAVGASTLPNTKLIQFLDVRVTGNTVFDESGTAVIVNDMTNPNVIYDVKIEGNRIR